MQCAYFLKDGVWQARVERVRIRAMTSVSVEDFDYYKLTSKPTEEDQMYCGNSPDDQNARSHFSSLFNVGSVSLVGSLLSFSGSLSFFVLCC